MLANPHLNQIVRVWYGRAMRDTMPYHGMIGTIAIVCKAKPRNHGVWLASGVPIKDQYTGATGSGVIAIPCGNLEKVEVHNDHLIHARRVKGGWMASVVPYRQWMPGNFADDRFEPGPHLYVSTKAGWRTVVNVMPTRAAVIDLAMTSIDMQGLPTLEPVIDYRDGRRKTPWQKEAERRRKAKEVNHA